MENKYQVPNQLYKELVSLLGKEEAERVIKEKEGSVSKLQWHYFTKKFRKQFGIDIRIVFFSFLAVIILLFILRYLNGGA